jgi:hypothetical protein
MEDFNGPSLVPNSISDLPPLKEDFNDFNSSEIELPPQPENVISPMESLVNDSKKAGFIHQIRDQLYYIEIYMYNQLEDQKPVAVPFLLVHSLAFEESLSDWNVKGWIVFDDKHETISRGSITESNQELLYSDSKNVDPRYVFRGDGRNKISFKIYPVPNTKNSYNTFSEPNSLPKEQWEMSFDCVIYDIEDMPVGNNHDKLRKYYFWDERYQFFLERNIEWSTRLQGIDTYISTYENKNMNYLRDKEPSQLNDFESSIPANIAIRSIIDTASLIDPKYENERGKVVNIGFTEGGGTIDKPNIPLNRFSIEWDNGYVDNNPQNNNHIFYTSPASSNVLDDLDYVMQNACSSEGYPVFLRFGRNSGDYIEGGSTGSTNKKNKEWELISLKKLLSRSKSEQVERLFIEDGILSKKPYHPRAPLYGEDIENYVAQNFTSGIASRIKSYKFSPMVSLDDMKIVNRPLHYYNFNNGTFNIISENNTAKSAIDKFTDAAKDNLYSFQVNKDAHILANLNQTKQKGIATKPAFAYRTFVPNNLPQIEMMKNLLFLNQAISFVSNGLTIRSPGRFIFIDSAGSNGERNAFNDRFLGQWIMTKVVHLFTKDNYLTEVVATKVDAFHKIWEIEDKNL